MLDIAISLGLVYLMLAAMVSGVQELLASTLQWRGKQMQRGIASLLDEVMTAKAPPGSLVSRVMKHPIIDALCDKDRRPAYIPAAHFAVALADELVREHGIARPLFQGLPEAVKRLPEGDLKRTLTTLVAQSGGQPAQLQALLENHFNLVMDRVSGWYKRRAQYVAFGIALAFAVVLNVDSLAIVRHLTANPEVSARLADQAARLVNSDEGRKLAGREAPTGGASGDASPAADPAAAVAKAGATLAAANTGLGGLRTDLPLGWPSDAAGKLRWPPGGALVIVGWLLTALAAMMGAPFWFDALSRLVPMRAAGKPPEPASGLPAAAAGGAASAAAAGATGTTEGTSQPSAAEAAGPRNDFEASQLTELDLLALQRALGLPPEAVTGRLDASTRAALAHWQERRGWPGTGAFDEAAVMALLYP